MSVSFSSRLSRQPSVEATAAEKRKKILKRRDEDHALSVYRSGVTSSLLDKEQSSSVQTRSIPPSTIGTPSRNGWALESTPQSVSPRTNGAPPRIVFGRRSGSAVPRAHSGRPPANSRSGSTVRAPSTASRRGRSVESKRGTKSRGGSRSGSAKGVRQLQLQQQQQPRDRVHSGSVLPTSARCVEISHGGLTLWCGDVNGCLNVLDGRDSTVLLIIDPPASGSFVEAIHQIGNAMWVGYTDGRVRVHDAQVLSVLFECVQPSKGAVTCFAPTDEGHVLYGSQDGTVTLLGGSAIGTSSHGERFAPCGSVSGSAFANTILEVRVSDVMVCTVDTRGKRAFVGLDDGGIVCVSLMESGDVLYRIRAHSCRVNRVVVGSSNLLFSCGDDSLVHAWECTTGSLVCHMKGHATPVADIYLDAGSSTLWTADESGVINVWSATVQEKFKCLQSIEDFTGTRIVSLKGLLLFTAATVWSIGNEQTNEVWKSSTNHLESTIDDALQGMHDIVKQDGVELVKWNDLLTTLQNGEEEQCKAVADGLLNVTERRALRGAFRKWSVFRVRRSSSRVKRKVDLALANHNSTITAELERSQREESEWERRYYAAKDRIEEAERRLSALVPTSNPTHQSSRAYQHDDDHHRCCRRVSLEQTQSRYASLMISRMEASAQSRLLTSSYLRWERWSSQRAHNKRRSKWAEVFQDTVLKSKLREYWWRWMNALQSSKSIATLRNRTLSLIGRQRERLLVSAYYFRWQRRVFAHTNQKRRMQENLTWLSSSSDAQVLQRYYTAWRHRRATDYALSKGIEDSEAALLAEQSAATSIELKQDLCDACDASIASVLDELSGRRVEISDARGAIDVARGFMTDAGEGGENSSSSFFFLEPDESESVSSARACVYALLGRLESVCINLYEDAEILAEVANAFDTVGAAHAFAEACRELQHQVAGISNHNGGDGTFNADRWTLSDTQISHMSLSQAQGVLKAIKTIILSYNVLPPEELDTLSAEEDALAINAEMIRRLVNHCMEDSSPEVEAQGSGHHSQKSGSETGSNMSGDDRDDDEKQKERSSATETAAVNPKNPPSTDTTTNAQSKNNNKNNRSSNNNNNNSSRKNSKSRNRRSSKRRRR